MGLLALLFIFLVERYIPFFLIPPLSLRFSHFLLLFSFLLRCLLFFPFTLLLFAF